MTIISTESGISGSTAPDERINIRPGRGGCAHYWIGTGERNGGRETFRCRYCGAVMSEPLRLRPLRVAAKPRARRGFSVCSLCGSHVHWTSTVRSPEDPSVKICLDCLRAAV